MISSVRVVIDTNVAVSAALVLQIENAIKIIASCSYDLKWKVITKRQ